VFASRRCSADAKFNVGAMMLGGFGVAKDYGQALAMFSHAANTVRATDRKLQQLSSPR
jgi:TPR repeat protein